MKKHAAILKNTASLILLIALLSLLLPFCRITTETKTITVSGMEVLKIGADAGYEYYSNGRIDHDYIVWDDLTWGDIEGGVTALDQKELRNVVIGIVIASLPVLFCLISIVFILFARGKKGMILPTLLIALALLQNIMMILAFFKLRHLLLPYVALTLLIGIYAFTIWNGITLAILILLWLTGGFSKPEQKKSDSKQKVRKRKKERLSERDPKEKKRKKRGKKKKKDKKNNKKKSKKRWFRKEKKEKKADRLGYEQEPKIQTRKQMEDKTEEYVRKSDDASGNISGDNRYKRTTTFTATGHIKGLTGMYEGTNLELSMLENGTITIGTTEEAVNALLKGSLRDIDKIAHHNCVIEYKEKSKQYKITSHSVTEILLQTGGEDNQFIRLKEGESQTVDSNTVLYIGNYHNSIRME